MVGQSRQASPLAARVAALAMAAAACGPAAAQSGGEGGAEAAVEAFARMADVLRHPLCLNCHQVDAPLQQDGRSHVPQVRQRR